MGTPGTSQKFEKVLDSYLESRKYQQFSFQNLEETSLDIERIRCIVARFYHLRTLTPPNNYQLIFGLPRSDYVILQNVFIEIQV